MNKLMPPGIALGTDSQPVNNMLLARDRLLHPIKQAAATPGITNPPADTDRPIIDILLAQVSMTH